ncbi:cupin domain-containing protein [Prosthecobacter dejongeii]|uniref:Quercetin 2,3-dioxygenase C-terminal cupin domain-containing protein n=1 Tax=Prosthecobacter dejongeii TaxID=48465 RepID=A0A7W8DMV0_9BACT|nr:hypothetical protein [Prosthecobacter dejongeii]MBB5035869.1 hypothetical protein [Prosthecobacter dejongeii]
MRRTLDFGDHAHRCLFQNDCVQAHLLGLKAGCLCFEACFPEDATVILTFGEASARIAGSMHQLRAGDQVEVPHASPLRLLTSSEADVMLLLKPTAA